jgi:hypothetical protein
MYIEDLARGEGGKTMRTETERSEDEKEVG